jgi:HSP20 family molecular chaperone IbpA
MPTIFNDNYGLLDSFFNDSWFDNNSKDIEKKLYGHRAKNVMNTDIKEDEHGYEMIIDLPGFAKEDVSAKLEEGYLTITANKSLENNTAKDEKAAKKSKYIRQERYSGSCSRTFYVGEDITEEDIKASFKHGILTLNIPKKDPVKQVPQERYIAIEG